MSKLSIPCPILFDHSGDHYSALIERQQNADRNMDTHKSSLFPSVGLAVTTIQCEDSDPLTHGMVVGQSLKATTEDHIRLG